MRKTSIVWTIMSLLLLPACFGGSANDPSPAVGTPVASVAANPDEARPIKLGFTVLGSFEFTDMIKDKLEAEVASRKNIELYSYEGHANAEQQLADVKDMIAKDVDVIILNPVNAAKSDVAVKMAVDAGIPVVGINTIPDTDLLTTYVGSSDIQVSEVQMQFIAESLGGEGNIVILRGLAEQSSQIQRAREY